MRAVKNEDFQPFSLRLVSGESRREIEFEYLFVYARDSDAVQMAIYSLCLCLCFFSFIFCLFCTPFVCLINPRYLQFFCFSVRKYIFFSLCAVLLLCVIF